MMKICVGVRHALTENEQHARQRHADLFRHARIERAHLSAFVGGHDVEEGAVGRARDAAQDDQLQQPRDSGVDAVRS